MVSDRVPHLRWTLAIALALAACAPQVVQVPRAIAVVSTPTLRYPVILTDMDGTALRSDNTVHPSTASAFARFRSCGGRVGIASGRSYPQLAPYLPDIQPNMPLVVMNGAAVVSPDGHHVLWSRGLPAGVYEGFVDHLRQDPDVDGVVVHDALDTFVVGTSTSFSEYLTRSKYGPVLALSARTSTASPLKVLARVRAHRTSEVERRLRTVLRDGTRVVTTSPETVEVLATQANKADAAEIALASMGFGLADTIAFGDGDNDVELLSRAGMGLAMRDCSPKSCAAASARIGDNDDDAIAAYVFRASSTCDSGWSNE